MKKGLLMLFVACTMACEGQSKPSGPCPFAGFDDAALQRKPNVAEIATKGPAHVWLACDSPKGCMSLPAEAGSPVLIYSVQDKWACGYYEDSHGAGAVWFRSTDLRPIRYDLNPPPAAWVGIWSNGSNRVRVAPAKGGGLRVTGNATWHGIKGVEHYGDLDGSASPSVNRLHLAPDGPDGCVVDMTLLGKFILASDNDSCGGMNVRFEGFWRRIVQR